MERRGPLRLWRPFHLYIQAKSRHGDCGTGDRGQAYGALMTVLDFWGGHGYQIVWVQLTTAPDGDAKRLAAHHQRLRRMVGRRWGFGDIQWAEALTLEGHGVIHALWAWKGTRSFYVPQR